MTIPARRLRLLISTFALTLVVISSSAAAASAYDEYFSGYGPPGGGYIQNITGAHTFKTLGGASEPAVQLACQLFNYQGWNFVGHGTGGCNTYVSSGSPYLHARVYNQSPFLGARLGGYACTAVC